MGVPLATAFCERDFTMGDLKRVYEAVWGVPLDLLNLYRKGPATQLYPPMTRTSHAGQDSPARTGGRSPE
ncbi:hypothetical protein [Actinoallomurus iriomotensis]|uniref:Uncharacterized protein n=1 Tax=Actinoallomurus iriomotensis TaxID=478107 RepID=A0A9W6RSJ5_9ACTN|nr:hypothetical protein Airi01_092400 [Actinoallomurus iriomotensis]